MSRITFFYSKRNIIIVILLSSAIVIGIYILLITKKTTTDYCNPSMCVSVSASFPKMDINYLSENAEIITIGTITESLPLEYGISAASNKSCLCVTDLIFQIDKIIYSKYEGIPEVIRLRIFKDDYLGKVLLVGNRYLLFLVRNNGASKDIFPETYQIMGDTQGAYYITGMRANHVGTGSENDWNVEELTSYLSEHHP